MIKNKEIAEILNISPSAVSLALNNRHGVSEETRRRVIALRSGSMAAEFNDLQLQNISRGLFLFIVLKKHGNVITNTPFFMSLSETLHQQAAVEGYGLQISYFQPGTDLQKYLYSLNVNQYEGLLVLGTEAEVADIRMIAALNKPTVILDSWFDSEKMDCVLMDNESGVNQAVHHAYSMGHRRIGFLNSYVNVNNFKERFKAYRSTMESLGLAFDEKYVYSIHSTLDGACADMCAILQKNPELPTVFVCANDLVAMGAINAMSKFGLNVPQDISVIGFDDMPVSAHLNPPLTSIRIHNRRIATLAVEMLTTKIRSDKPAKANLRCLVSVELMERESVKKLGQEQLRQIKDA